MAVFEELIVLVLLVEAVIVFVIAELTDSKGEALGVLDDCAVVVAAFVRTAVLLCNGLDVLILDARLDCDLADERVDVLDALAEKVGIICAPNKFLALYSCSASHFSGGLVAIRPIIDNNKIQRIIYYSIC